MNRRQRAKRKRRLQLERADAMYMTCRGIRVALKSIIEDPEDYSGKEMLRTVKEVLGVFEESAMNEYTNEKER